MKTSEDFKVLAYIYDNTGILPSPNEFNEYHAAIGKQALALPLVGSEGKTCFQSLVEHWVGTEELVYALADYPEAVEECLTSMRQVSMQTVKHSVECNAEAFIFWEDSSTTNVSPSYFEKYALPEINSWGDVIHSAGKQLLHHACGHLKGLLPMMANAKIDIVESISPPPTGNIELWEAKDILPEWIGLIGGIEPTVFLNSTEQALEEYVRVLIAKMGKSSRFILANSDSCPPGVSWDKFRLVSGIIRDCSR